VKTKVSKKYFFKVREIWNFFSKSNEDSQVRELDFNVAAGFANDLLIDM